MKRRAPGPARTDLANRTRPRHCAGDSMHDHPGQTYAPWSFIRRALARVVTAA